MNESTIRDTRRILVVDDEATLRSVIRQVLTDDGHEVVEAENAERALELFRGGPFPLVLTDIYMGKMNGIELLEELKRQEPDTMVVVMTSNATLETATSALRCGAYDYLTKPFEDLELISAVAHRALDRLRLIEDNQKLVEDLKRHADELARLNERLSDLASRDGLTELYNHRHFRQALDGELARSVRHGRVFSVIFMDIDHFKHYNDTNGHLAGDDLLRSMARLLRRTARPSTIAARYGGEEFVLIVPEATKPNAMSYAENLRAAVAAEPFAGGMRQPLGRISLSLGVATFPEDGEDADTLLDRADQALYSAKSGGRDRAAAWGDPGPTAEGEAAATTSRIARP